MSIVSPVNAANETERFDRFIPIGKIRYGPVSNWPDKVQNLFCYFSHKFS